MHPCNRVAALLQRWLLGTHQGAVSHAHLDYYLDEYTFRFNRRTSRYRGKLFYRLIQQAVAIEPVPYTALVKHVRGPKPKNYKISWPLEPREYPYKKLSSLDPLQPIFR